MSDYRGDQYAFQGINKAGGDLSNFLLGLAHPQASGGGSPSLADRLTAGGAAVAQGYDKFIDQQNQINAAGKSGKYYFDANPEALAEMGKTPEEAKNFGSRDWAALMDAHKTKTVLNDTLAKINELNMQGQYYQDRGAHATAQDQADTSYGQAVGQMQAPNSYAQQLLASRAESPVQAPGLANALTSLARPQPLSPLEHYNLAVRSGVDPERAGNMAKNLMAIAPGSAENNTPVWGKGPNGEDYMFQPATKNGPIISPFSKAAARVNEIDAQGEASAGKGLLPPGTTFETTSNGFGIATLPDGSMKHLGRVPPAPAQKKNFFASLMGGNGGGTNAPAADTPTVKFNSAAEVKAAYHAGKLDKDSATKLLQTQFGMQ